MKQTGCAPTTSGYIVPLTISIGKISSFHLHGVYRRLTLVPRYRWFRLKRTITHQYVQCLYYNSMGFSYFVQTKTTVRTLMVLLFAYWHKCKHIYFAVYCTKDELLLCLSRVSRYFQSTLYANSFVRLFFIEHRLRASCRQHLSTIKNQINSEWIAVSIRNIRIIIYF